MKSLRLVFTLLILRTLVATASSQNACGEVNLNDNLGPIRNQSNVGWCFANTAADLLTYMHASEIKSHNESLYMSNKDLKPSILDYQVSAIFAALNYFRAQVDGGVNHKEVFSGGGFIQKAIQIVQDRSFLCPQTLDQLLLTTGSKTLLKEKFIKFEEIYTSYQNYIRFQNESSKSLFFQHIAELEKNNTFLSVYPKNKIKEVLSKPTLEEAVMALLDVVCENRKIPISNKYNFSSITSYRDQSQKYYYSNGGKVVDSDFFINKIDFSLNQNIPLGVTYDIENILRAPKISSGAHASVISGRKTINGICHYQIRNSWGNDCTRLALIDGKLDPKYNIYSYPCENGTIWIPKGDLKSLLYEIVFMDLQ